MTKAPQGLERFGVRSTLRLILASERFRPEVIESSLARVAPCEAGHNQVMACPGKD